MGALEDVVPTEVGELPAEFNSEDEVYRLFEKFDPEEKTCSKSSLSMWYCLHECIRMYQIADRSVTRHNLFGLSNRTPQRSDALYLTACARLLPVLPVRELERLLNKYCFTVPANQHNTIRVALSAYRASRLLDRREKSTAPADYMFDRRRTCGPFALSEYSRMMCNARDCWITEQHRRTWERDLFGPNGVFHHCPEWGAVFLLFWSMYSCRLDENFCASYTSATRCWITWFREEEKIMAVLPKTTTTRSRIPTPASALP